MQMLMEPVFTSNFSPSTEVWLPDITPYDHVGPMESDYLSWEKTSRVVIKSSGLIHFVPPVTYRSHCSLTNPSEWPWGEQNCSLAFGSWTYDKSEVDVEAAETSVEYFRNNRVRREFGQRNQC